MKRCPSCNKTFDSPNLSFCVDDGTPLLTVDDEETVVHPSASQSGPAPEAPVYQPPRTYVPPGGSAPKQKAWPWVLGILALVLLLIIGGGIFAAIFLPKMLRSSSTNRNANIDRPANVNSNRSQLNNNSNSGSNQNENSPVQNENSSTTTEDSAAPTGDELVLSQLTDLENEWTAANINADKKALDRILADDYVSTLNDGRAQGKAEYLKTIERDQTIQKWNFEDLKVSSKNGRATLTGVLRLQAQGQEVLFRFTDKFVWRDGRWQATGSEVSRIQ